MAPLHITKLWLHTPLMYCTLSRFIFYNKGTSLFWTDVYLSSSTARYFIRYLAHKPLDNVLNSLDISSSLARNNPDILRYASKIHGKVAATSARIVNADSRTNRHRPVVQILRLRLRWGWTAVITTLSASSSTMGRPSALMTKIWDALWLGLISLCRRTRSEIPLKHWEIQLTPPRELPPESLRALCSSTTGRGRGTSRVCALSTVLSAANGTNASFCFLMNVRCRQMGQTIVSLMFPSVLMLTSVLTRQSWQNTWPQLKVLSAPDRHS